MWSAYKPFNFNKRRLEFFKEKNNGEAASAGGSAGMSFSGAFSGALSGAGIALGATAVAIGGVTTALIEGVSSTAEYADNIDKASQKLGISSTAYQEWDAVLQHSGTSMESMSTTFKTLAKASQDATADQASAFEKLGLSMDAISGMSADELFGSVIAGLQNMEEGTERTTIASTLLGRGAMEMGALLNTSAEDTQAMIDRVHELGGVLDEDAIKNGAAFTDAMQDMNTAMEGLKNGAMAELLPSFTTVIDGLTDIFSGDNSGIGKVAGGITMIAQKIIEALPTILETGSQIVQSLVTAIITNLPMIGSTAITIISELANFILDNLDMIIDVAFTLLETLIDGITQAVPQLLSKIVELVPKIVETIISKLPLILKAGITLLTELINGIISALPTLIKALPEVINTIVSTLLSMIDLIVTAGIDLITALTGPEALPQIIDAIVETMPLIISSIIDALIQLYPRIWEAGFNLYIALLENMPDVLLKIGESIFDLVGKIIDTLIEKWPDIQEAGLNALSMIFEKVSEIVTLAQTKVKEIIDAVIEKFQSAIEDFKEIGKWIIEQIFEGFSNNIGWLKDKIGGLLDAFGGEDGFFSGSKESTVNQANKAAMYNLNSNANIATSAEISMVNNSMDAVYALLATYLPQLAEGENVTVEVNADIDNIFDAIQKKSREFKYAKGVSAFA